MIAPSKADGALADHAALVEDLERVANTLEKHRFVEQVASGYYYRSHVKYFDPSKTVDRCLLDDLSAIGDRLCRDGSANERKRVHALLGRIIFTCYLIDREIIYLRDYPFIRSKGVTTLLDLFEQYGPQQAKELLYQLFAQLREDFNGSMFDDNLDAERQSISDNDIDALKRFFRGEQLQSGQRTFGFWAYDFSIIPVETISAIYEKFLEEEDASGKEATGAFYTPKHLAEMVVDEAVASFDSLLEKRYLDPACGSGVFLVILFNRIAEEWQRRNPNAQVRTKVRELLVILEQKICGVDVNLTACRITCFSLYVAFLDQFDRATLRELQTNTELTPGKTGKILPKLLAYKCNDYKNTDTPAIFEGNFFNPALPIHGDFDVVVGNPPWVGRNQPADKQIEDWIFSEHNPYLGAAPKARAKRIAVFLPQRQIAHAFLWKAPTCMKETARTAFLLPSEVLLNQTDDFQNAWFRLFQVERVLHFADFRMFLFSGAKRPCFIASFGPKKPEPITRVLEYVVPKVRQQDPRSGLVPISADDRKWISLQDLLDACARSRASVLWKSYLWGTVRDLRLLDYLSQSAKLDDIAGEPGSDKRWMRGHGFKPWYQIGYDENPASYGEPKPIPGRLSDPFAETVNDNLQMFLLQDDCCTLRKRLSSIRCKGKPRGTPEDKLRASLDGFYRSPDERLFQPPLVLVNNGFTKFTFADFHVFYQDSLTGIHGRRDDEDLLRFFTIYVKSKLAAYFLFHTASSWGTERDRVLVHELMRLPFPLPGSSHVSPRTAEIVKQASTRMMEVQRSIADRYAKAREEAEGRADYQLRAKSIKRTRKEEVEALQAALEPLIYEYFDLSEEEKVLVEDTFGVYERSAAPASPTTSVATVRPTTTEDRLAYSTLLCNTLNEWSRIDQPEGKKQPFHFYAECAPLIETGMVLVSIKRAAEKAESREVQINRQVGKAIERLARASTRQEVAFAYLRGIIFGDRDADAIHVFKPDLLGQWTKTSALNDADEVFQAVIQSKSGRK